MSVTAPRKHQGFTIVELLIVIVVIAILAAISIVAYNGIQQRARDGQRKSDIETITKALELYYIDNGAFPQSLCASSCTVNNGWSSSADVGWNTLKTALVPKYISSLPIDPTNTTSSVLDSGAVYNYAYYSRISYCETGQNMTYLLVYRFESAAREEKLVGDCPTNAIGPYPAPSNYRVVKR